MNIHEVKRLLKEIKQNLHDEQAHELEDQLFVKVLTHIARGGSNGSALAKRALRSRQIQFFRWYA